MRFDIRQHHAVYTKTTHTHTHKLRVSINILAIAIVGVWSSIVINVPTRYLLVVGTKQSFQIVVGTFA